jgi:hypothetical protein
MKHQGLFASGALTLTCADPACGCKITYAPKFKAKGVTYHYYRCSNGRRVHSARGEPQVNVREDLILSQLVRAVDAIHITVGFAEAVARALNETHEAAVAAKKKSADVFRAELREMEQKENRLFDRFDSGEVDRTVFDQQLARPRRGSVHSRPDLRRDGGSLWVHLLYAGPVGHLQPGDPAPGLPCR